MAIKLVKNIFESPENQNILVVGAGSLAQDVIKSLYGKGINNIKSVNRSIKKIAINEKYEILSSSLEALHDHLENADIVIASSATELPLIGKGAIENALKARRNKPMLLIDLGVPRNIEEEIRDIEQAYLFSIDDIEKITQENYGQRSIEAEKAMNIIVMDAQAVLDLYLQKSLKGDINIQLEAFLKTLSEKELQQFKISKDFTELVKAIKTSKTVSKNLNNFENIKNIDDHIIESMIKRFFDNA